MSSKMSEEVRNAYQNVHMLYEKEKQERSKRAWSNGVLWALLRIEDGESFDAIATKAMELGVDLTKLHWQHPRGGK